MKIKSLTICGLLLLVIGCSSVTPVVQFYQLSQPPKAQGVDLALPKLVVEQVELVDYLDRSNLLLQRASGQLYVTKYHVWAEPLDQAIARTMVNYLNSSQQVFRAESRFQHRCRAECYRLKLVVEQFYPTEKSTVVFSGKYQLRLGGELIAQHDFNYSEPLSDDGYPVAVTSLHGLTVKLASQIQHQLR